jgi:apolipoprotein N-acyltransferase
MAAKHPRLDDRFGRIAAALGAGALAAAGQALVNWGLPTFLGVMAAAWLFLAQTSPKRSFRTGWLFGTAYFAVALHWIVEPFLVYPASTGWMAPFALAGLAGGLGLIWALAWRIAFTAGQSAVIWAFLMTLAELLRAYLFTGFPWAMPSYAWVNSIAAQLGAYVGPHGLNLILFLAAGSLVQGLRNAKRVTWQYRAGLAFVVALSILPMLGPTRMNEDGPLVRLIQPNAPQHEKWAPDKVKLFFDRQISLTAGPGAPDVIIWPETAVAFPIPHANRSFEAMSNAAGAATVITGVQRIEGARTYNSMAVLDTEGQVQHIYDKHHLVPFGEYIPLGEWLLQFGISGLAARDGVGYARGQGPKVLNIEHLGSVLPLICYEVVFPQDLRTTERPELLLQITNDAWFGKFSGPFQHLAQARMRAIETGLPMLRVANTGVTAVIDAHGRVIDSIPLGQFGKLDTRLPEPRAATPYARTGDLPLTVLLIALIAFSAYRLRRNSN